MFTTLRLLLAACVLAALTLTGCQTAGAMQGIQSARIGAITESIRNEPPGNYFIGRRLYKNDYKFWGFVRSPGQPWSTAKLVMLNEQSKLAPDRELGRLGSDNNYEYKLYGSFSGQTVYEPASNGFYPEFVLRAYELRSVSPGTIYRTAGALDPSRRVIPQVF
jgi:predicted small secreted protein